MGVGETALIVVGAAISNAVFDATGVKLREIPFTPEKVKAAFAAQNVESDDGWNGGRSRDFKRVTVKI